MSGKENGAARIVLITLSANILLAMLKVAAGIMAHSIALLAEAVHSCADIVASSGVFFGLRLSTKPADDSHPYGHGKIESVVAGLIAVLLILIGARLCTTSLYGLARQPPVTPAPAALWVAASALLCKEWMYRYTLKMSLKMNSVVLAADAWHHRTDALMLTGVFIGVLGARVGLPALDPLAGLVISLLIVKAGLSIGRGALNQLVDAMPDHQILRRATELAMKTPGVEEVHTVRARQYGNSVHLDLKIGVDSRLDVASAHAVAKQVKACIKNGLPHAGEVLIHVNPHDPPPPNAAAETPAETGEAQS